MRMYLVEVSSRHNAQARWSFLFDQLPTELALHEAMRTFMKKIEGSDVHDIYLNGWGTEWDKLDPSDEMDPVCVWSFALKQRGLAMNDLIYLKIEEFIPFCGSLGTSKDLLAQ